MPTTARIRLAPRRSSRQTGQTSTRGESSQSRNGSDIEEWSDEEQTRKDKKPLRSKRTAPPPKTQSLRNQGNTYLPAVRTVLNFTLFTPLRALKIALVTFLGPFLGYLLGFIISILFGAIAIWIIAPLVLRAFRFILLQSIRFAARTAFGTLSSQLTYGGVPSWATNVGSSLTLGSICSTLYVPYICSDPNLKNKRYRLDEVARGLQENVRSTHEIYDSIYSLTGGDADALLHYTTIWELGVAVKVGSNLPDKVKISSELMRFGDQCRDVTDAVMDLDSRTRMSFSWIVHTFERLEIQLVALEEEYRDSGSKLPKQIVDAKLTPMVLRVKAHLDTIHDRAVLALAEAKRAKATGDGLNEELMAEKLRLKDESRIDPVWMHWKDNIVQALAGAKEPSKRQLIKRDLELTQYSHQNIQVYQKTLERVVQLLKKHRTQVSGYGSMFMGAHLGNAGFTNDEQDNDPRAEMDMLRVTIADITKALKNREEKPQSKFRPKVKHLENS